MSAPPSPMPLPAPRFAPQKPSPLSQGHSLLTSDPEPSSSTATAKGPGGSGKKKHYHHHHHHGSGSNKRKRESGPAASSSAGAGAAGGSARVAAGAQADSNPGRQFATQIVKLVDALKQNNGPMNLSDLEAVTNVRGLLDDAEVHTDVTFNRALYDAFNAHERVVVHEKGRVKLFSYRPDFAISSAAQVLELLKRYQNRGGMSVPKLKESWPAVQGAIDDLEAQGKVYVLRAGVGSEGSKGAVGGETKKGPDGEVKGGLAKTVLYNPLAGEMDGKDGKVRKLAMDDEFQDMFRSLATPPAHTLSAELAAAGLSSSATGPNDPNAAGAGAGGGPGGSARRRKGAKKGPGSGQRKVKITNTHLGRDAGIDLSRDYVPGHAQGASGSGKGKGRR